MKFDKVTRQIRVATHYFALTMPNRQIQSFDAAG